MDAHGAEEVRALEVGDYLGVFALCWNVARDTEVARVARSPIAHRQMGCHGSRRDTLGITKAIEQTCEEDARAAVIVAGAREIDDGGDCFAAIESNGAIEDVERSACKQAAADQYDEADAELKTQ